MTHTTPPMWHANIDLPFPQAFRKLRPGEYVEEKKVIPDARRQPGPFWPPDPKRSHFLSCSGCVGPSTWTEWLLETINHDISYRVLIAQGMRWSEADDCWLVLVGVGCVRCVGVITFHALQATLTLSVCLRQRWRHPWLFLHDFM